jgi:hypothetical protein
MNEQRIGIIADTHRLLRPEAVEALKGSSLITHLTQAKDLYHGEHRVHRDF